MRIITATLLFALPVATACKKSDEKKTVQPTPAASPVPAAPAPVAPASAAPAPAAPDLKVVVPGDSADLAGTYDGARAIYVKIDATQLIAIPKGSDCPAFDCGFIEWTGYASDKMTAACPKTSFALITLGDDKHKDALKPGPVQGRLDIQIPGGGSSLAGPDFGDIGVKLTAVGADAIAGTIDFKGAEAMSGAFKAKVCPAPQPAN